MPGILPPIAFQDLIARLSDPESDLEHDLGYMIEVTVPGRMAPDLEPNPSLVTGIPPRLEGGFVISLANGLMRTRRFGAYRNRLNAGWDGHRIVSEGDSWFQHPLVTDIIDHLMVDHAILSLDAAGDRLVDIINQREILLNLSRERASALLLSAGGNDLFENGQLGRLVEEPFPGATAEALVGAKLDVFLKDLGARYLDLLRRVHRALPKVHILIHGYGPAFPQGNAWIGRPLTERGVPPGIQHEVVRVILRKFNRLLAGFAARAEFQGRLAHVDLTDLGRNIGDWHDEIHLNGPTAARAADRFRRELARRLTGAAPESAVTEAGVAAGPDLPVPLRPAAPAHGIVAVQAERLSALDESTLLRELDLRVALMELDPTLADAVEMAPLVIGRALPELGIASLRTATRRLIDHWEADLRELICNGGTGSGDPVATAILGAVGKSRTLLSGAIAGWLVTGPLAVPAVLASALAAWLAARLFDAGRDAFCAVWRPGPGAPALLRDARPETGVTVGELRAKFATPEGDASFSADAQKELLERLDGDLAEKVVAPPSIPVDAEGAKRFRMTAAGILARLGGESEKTLAGAEAAILAEAIVKIDGKRPALIVKDGFVDLTDKKLVSSGWAKEVKKHRKDILRLTAASGRIIRGSDRSADSVYGSAWMLEGGRVATARHVIEHPTFAEQIGAVWFIKQPFFVDFGVEAGSRARSRPGFPHRRPILTLAPRDVPFPPPIPLAAPDRSDALVAEQWFFNVGHPAAPSGSWLVDGEDGNPATISRALFSALIGDMFGVKRLSPGRIDFSPGSFLGDDKKWIITHDATTLGGSSGSGIMSIDKNGAAMSGLHFAGIFGTRNYAHWLSAVPDLHR